MPEHGVTSPAAAARAALILAKAALCSHGVPASHCADCGTTTETASHTEEN